MKNVKKGYLGLGLILLMILRPLANGGWVSSIAVCGLFISLLDIMKSIEQMKEDLIGNERYRYGFVFLILMSIGAVIFMLMVWNIAIPISWFNSPLFLDEVTLLELLICLFQKKIVEWINNIIKYPCCKRHHEK